MLRVYRCLGIMISILLYLFLAVLYAIPIKKRLEIKSLDDLILPAFFTRRMIQGKNTG